MTPRRQDTAGNDRAKRPSGGGDEEEEEEGSHGHGRGEDGSAVVAVVPDTAGGQRSSTRQKANDSEIGRAHV